MEEVFKKSMETGPQEIFKGRLGHKGSRMPDVLEGQTLTMQEYLSLLKDPSLSGLDWKQKTQKLIELGKIKLPIIYIKEKYEDMTDMIFNETPPAKVVVTSSGTTSHGVSLVREVELRGGKFAEVFSGVTVVCAVKDLEKMKGGEIVEVDATNPNDVVIKVLS